MSYKEKPQLKLYAFTNNQFILQAIIDDYQECSFEDNLYDAGQFSVTINFNIPNSQLFQRGLFIQFGNSWKFGEITKIQDQIGEDGKGSQYRIITGYDARYILKRRVIKNMNSNDLWIMTGKGEIVLRNLINDQAGTNAEQKRKLPIINTIPTSENAIGKEYSASEQFSNLYEVCKTIATQSEIGWRLEFNGTNLTLVCFNGTDRTQTVQFSTSFDSLANGEFIDSSESFSNAIYVGGKGQNDDRDIYEGESAIEGNSPAGLDRFESWDNQSSMTTESEYETEALSMLNQYGQTLTMSGNGLAKCPYEYEKEYFVGDKIKIAFSGKSANAQILSVTEHWAFGAYEINFSFGKPLPDLNAQLQLILKQIQKASNKTNSTDSVRWYTIPTDTAMPKADVTYNTIGFVGDVGSGATFTLYLDNEKTGAKSYHVWFKQLAGNGKLTLTTGKSGAVNLEFGGGTYVAIISVDENGNIVNVASTPTDTIASGNNQPATSQGVANALSGKVNTDTYTDTNLNTLINTGFYIVGYVNQTWDNLNYPVQHYGTVLVGTTDSGNLMQIFMSDDGQLVYVRNCTTNSWSSWKKVLTIDDLMSGSQANPINDCNLATRNGIWYFSNAQNCPPASIGFNAPDNNGSLYVQAFDSNWVNQICQDYYSDGTIFIRSCNLGVWTSWKKVSINADFGQWKTVANLGNNGTSFAKGLSTPNGKYLYLRLNGLSSGTYNNGDVLFTLPEGWRPNQDPTRVIVSIDTPIDRITAGLDIHSNGVAHVYFQGNTQFGQSVTVSGFYIDAIILLTN